MPWCLPPAGKIASLPHTVASMYPVHYGYVGVYTDASRQHFPKSIDHDSSFVWGMCSRLHLFSVFTVHAPNERLVVRPSVHCLGASHYGAGARRGPGDDAFQLDPGLFLSWGPARRRKRRGRGAALPSSPFPFPMRLSETAWSLMVLCATTAGLIFMGLKPDDIARWQTEHDGDGSTTKALEAARMTFEDTGHRPSARKVDDLVKLGWVDVEDDTLRARLQAQEVGSTSTSEPRPIARAGINGQRDASSRHPRAQTQNESASAPSESQRRARWLPPPICPTSA